MISWIKPRSVVTNYSECLRLNSAYRDTYVTRSQTQSLVCLWVYLKFTEINNFLNIFLFNVLTHFFQSYILFIFQSVLCNLLIHNFKMVSHMWKSGTF